MCESLLTSGFERNWYAPSAFSGRPIFTIKKTGTVSGPLQIHNIKVYIRTATSQCGTTGISHKAVTSYSGITKVNDLTVTSQCSSKSPGSGITKESNLLLKTMLPQSQPLKNIRSKKYSTDRLEGNSGVMGVKTGVNILSSQF